MRKLSVLKSIGLISLLSLLSAPAFADKVAQKVSPKDIEDQGKLSNVPYIEIFDDIAERIIDKDSPIEVVAAGFKWTEGPLWLDKQGYLIFSDIPNNKIMKYQPNIGVSLYLDKSGATGLSDGDSKQGSNGLLLNHQGELILLQQGDRRVAKMLAPLDVPKNDFFPLATQYQQKRLNSPNDAVLHSNGSLFFTDPPYGLTHGMEDKNKALPFQGVYRLTTDGELDLLDDEVSFPNGIALSKNENTLYVAVSDQKRPHWLAYDVSPNGDVSNKRLFIDATKLLGIKGEQGMPDGMAVHSSGLLFATGPGGVWIVEPTGKVLAKIRTGRLTANCTLTTDEEYLYMTAHDALMRVKLN